MLTSLTAYFSRMRTGGADPPAEFVVRRGTRPAANAERPLRLLVLAHANRTGGARSVALNLLDALVALDEPLEIIGVLPVGCGYEQIARRLSSSTIWFDQRGSIRRRFLFDAILLPRRLHSLRPDAVLALGNIGMQESNVPQVILLHDPHFVYPRRFHGTMPMLERARYLVQRRQVRRCLQAASTVFCQTPIMLERVRSTFRTRGPVKLLPNSISRDVTRGLIDVAVPVELACFPDSFRLICLTQYYPHKNLEGIVEVFRRFRQELRGVVVFLTISPTQGPGARRLLAAIERHHLSRQIVNLGPLEQDRIPAYFQNCHAMLFPTFMESFSAAYLEAMMLNLPILTSDLDFAREVCGAAALYFDPWNPESILKAILRIRQEAKLRQGLAETGRARLAEAYSRSWADIAVLVAAELRKATVGRSEPDEAAKAHPCRQRP